MTLHRFHVDALPEMPWKNGGGTTKEIACWPPGAGLANFDWRVSIATIAASGPFSIFEGVDRSILLLSGDGVQLASANWQHRLDAPHRPFDFDGAEAVACTLLGGASRDFNVMTRRARLQAQVRVLDGAQQLPPASQGLLLCLAGPWQADDQSLAAGEGLWWHEDDDAPRGWALRPGGANARLIAVCWQAVNDKTR